MHRRICSAVTQDLCKPGATRRIATNATGKSTTAGYCCPIRAAPLNASVHTEPHRLSKCTFMQERLPMWQCVHFMQQDMSKVTDLSGLYVIQGHRFRCLPLR